ncbi:MAG: hypothetical protein J7497_14550, partial [Chitinophagaceae bacterium]|nr:hypothetical protein [Chitinophagaceae bacterium]
MKNSLIYLLLLSILQLSCKKDWLDAKPQQSLVVPNTLQNLQALLEDTYTFNDYYSNTTITGSDEYYIT